MDVNSLYLQATGRSVEHSYPAIVDAVALYEMHREWAEKLALQLYFRFSAEGSEKDDYVQYAQIGLLEAAQRFNPEYGTPFRAYAKLRIRGEILNNVVKFSEKSQLYSWQREQLRSRLESISQEKPSKQPGSIIETILELALGFVLEDHDLEQSEPELSGPYFTSQEMTVLQDSVVQLLNDLPEPQSAVLHSHYRYGLSFAEVADYMALSKGRVSQLHKEGLQTLRKKLRW